MTTYYTKGEDGELSEVNPDDMFKERKQRWQTAESAKIREEVEKTVRDELSTSVKSAEDKVRSELQKQIDEANSMNQKLEVTLRQKTIAHEYGFKPGTEKYLGNGSEEEMRKEADTLKNEFGNTKMVVPDKSTETSESEVQNRTGIKVNIT